MVETFPEIDLVYIMGSGDLGLAIPLGVRIPFGNCIASRLLKVATLCGLATIGGRQDWVRNQSLHLLLHRTSQRRFEVFKVREALMRRLA